MTPMTQRRRFTLLDSLVLLAATAGGFAVTRSLAGLQAIDRMESVDYLDRGNGDPLGKMTTFKANTVESAVSCAAHGFKTLPLTKGGYRGVLRPVPAPWRWLGQLVAETAPQVFLGGSVEEFGHCGASQIRSRTPLYPPFVRGEEFTTSPSSGICD